MTVEVGQQAPDFELPDQQGNPVRLSSFRGDREVLVVFYPLAFSPVCEGELCAIRDELARTDDTDGTDGDGTAAVVLAISVDSPVTHRAWATLQGYAFPLLADFWPHGAVARAYGVFDEERGVATRGSFLVDRAGVVRWTVHHGVRDPREVTAHRAALHGAP